MQQIQKLNHRHDAIAEWLIANPDKTLGECAATFGYTQSWLSIIVNSDAFRAVYEAKLGEYHDERIVPLRDKVHGIANRAVEKLGVSLDAATDPDFILDVADKMLNRLGYGAKASGGQTNIMQNNLTVIHSVDSEALARARERLAARHRPELIEQQTDTTPGHGPALSGAQRAEESE